MNTKRFFALFLLLASTASFVNASKVVDKKAGPTVTATKKVESTVVAYVDVEKVIAKSKSLTEDKENLEARMKKKADPVEKLNKEMEEKAKKMQSDTIKEDAKNKLQEELQNLAQKRMAMMNGLQGDMQKLQEDFIESVKKRLIKIGKKFGWDLIVFPGPTIVVNEKVDKTSFLINELNKEYEAAKKKNKNKNKNK